MDVARIKYSATITPHPSIVSSRTNPHPIALSSEPGLEASEGVVFVITVSVVVELNSFNNSTGSTVSQEVCGLFGDTPGGWITARFRAQRSKEINPRKSIPNKTNNSMGINIMQPSYRVQSPHEG